MPSAPDLALPAGRVGGLPDRAPPPPIAIIIVASGREVNEVEHIRLFEFERLS
jgi:hypothetical protein